MMCCAVQRYAKPCCAVWSDVPLLLLLLLLLLVHRK
jgi:hypothetical protein